MSEEKEISFVAKHYRKNSFSVDKAWASLGVASPSKWRVLRAAAVVAGVVVLSATAAIIYNHYEPSATEPTVETVAETPSPSEVVRVIDFEEATLPVVVETIKEVYGVKIVNLPENADSYRLSLRYEGTAEDLLTTINEILDTEMSVEK
ncbi:MAG: hypothetical protein K2I89_00995 [Muribaculaceae bacterium]|nr:hypothetical protein [Muribaculaceae bacterium]